MRYLTFNVLILNYINISRQNLKILNQKYTHCSGYTIVTSNPMTTVQTLSDRQ